MDLPGGTVRFDDRKAKMLGYAPEIFRHYSDFTSLLHPDDLDRTMQAMRDHLDGAEEKYHADYRIQTSDGRYLWLRDIGGITERNPDGSVKTVTGIVVDITKNKQAEEALREAEWKFRTVANHTYDWEYWQLPDGTFSYCSPSCERITGYTRDEFYLDPGLMPRIIHPDDIKLFKGHQVSRNKTDFKEDDLELRIINRDGSTVWINHVCRAIIDEHGTYLGQRGSNRDITNRKMMEEEIKSLNRVLEQRVEDRTRELNEALQERELLIREIHHRVKNNIQVIASLLNWQSQTIMDPISRNILQDAQDRVRSIALVHENLYQSRSLDSINYQDFLKKIIRYLYETHSVDPARVRVKIACDPISLHIDKAVPCSLIINEMVTNAFKHAFPGDREGDVEIGLYNAGDYIRLEYHDNGCGIPESVTFERSESLGMKLISGLTRQIRGSLALDRQDGTHYTITFPA